MPDAGFWRFAQAAPERLALVDSSGRRWSRGTLHAGMNRVSRAMRAEGIGTCDVVAILAPNCLEFICAYMAATQIGAYVVPINWHLASSEIAYVLTSSRARLLFAHERLAGVIHQLHREGALEALRRVSFGTLPGFTPLAEFSGGHDDSPLEQPIQGRMLLYTSATTGRPKAISLPIDSAAESLDRTIAFNMSSGLALDGEVHLCASMLYHAGPLDFATVALHMGHLVVLAEHWRPQLLLDLIQTHRVSTTFMVPTMFVQLLKLPEAARAACDTSSLKLVLHSAAPCPVQTKRRMIEWWGPVLRDGYAAAEGGGTVATSEDWLRYPGTVGKPVPGSRIRILDDDGNELPPGAVGTIYLTRYQGDRFEYRDDPEKTRAAYRGELFTVGDVGYVNEDGYLFICDRKVDMIICGGMNIYPAEIEQVLVQHPSVADCAVFGIPDDVMGEAVHAVIQPAAHAQVGRELTAQIMRFLSEHLASSKLPRRIEFATDLPRDPNGKLFKRQLRQAYWQGKARTI
jgi:long-chain acyl-CoA synthetase